ncbi:serine/threonine-protein kinase [Nocardioides sp.]|uniref:serine/threonine-protein kinase n=1 Tax=Nocardioides sp. TaxID=35761 RepID=UPI0035141E73
MSTPTPEPGTRLGPFELGDRLGAGGMGVVFEALDTSLGRRVALKVIAPHVAQDPDFRARFTREAQAQASLDSPHVVQVYSFGEADGRLYIASQLVPDGDLGQMLRRHGHAPPRIALHLAAQIADGLATAHAAGLVHRDIKPANVLLRDREGSLHAYLADFGIARRQQPGPGPLGGLTQVTQAGHQVGTPSYMAPELHTGTAPAGQAADQYALGCLLWTMLAGAAPFQGGTDYQVVMGHVEGPIPQVVGGGPLALGVNRLLQLVLAKRPEDRFPSVAVLREELRRLTRLSDDPTLVVPGAGGAPPAGTAPGFDAVKMPPPPPTPGPTPTPPPAAPPTAPLSAPLSGPFPTPFPTPAGGPPPGAFGAPAPAPRRRRGVLVAVALVALLGLGGAGALALAGGDDDPVSGGGATTASPTPQETASIPPAPSPSPAEPTGPTEPTAPTDPAGGDYSAREQQAIDAIAEEFGPQGTPESARCIGERLVDAVGVDGLIAGGLLTPDLEVGASSADPEAAAALLDAVQDATTDCIEELTGG